MPCRPPTLRSWPIPAQATLRLAAHRFFCACDIRFRAAAETLRRPRLAARDPLLAALRPLRTPAARAADADAVVAVAPPRRAAHRAFWASDMGFRAAGEIARVVAFGVLVALPAATEVAWSGVSEPAEGLAGCDPLRRAAQYFFIRSPTALRSAAVMVRRRPLAGASDWPPDSRSATLARRPGPRVSRSSGNARRIASTSRAISVSRASAPTRA